MKVEKGTTVTIAVQMNEHEAGQLLRIMQDTGNVYGAIGAGEQCKFCEAVAESIKDCGVPVNTAMPPKPLLRRPAPLLTGENLHTKYSYLSSVALGTVVVPWNCLPESRTTIWVSLAEWINNRG